MEVGRVKPAFLIDLGEVIDEAIDCGHVDELQSQSVEKDVNVVVEGSQHALADLIGMGARDE